MNLLNLAPAIQEALMFLPEVKEGRDPATERDLRAWRRRGIGSGSNRHG